MTVIAAWWTPTQGVIAADALYQRSTGLGGLQTTGASKVHRIRQGLVGVAGSTTLTDDLLTRLHYVDRLPSLRTAVAQHRAEMRTLGHGEVSSGLWSLDEAAIVVLPEGLYTVFGDGSVVTEPQQGTDRYTAIGFGRDQAFGALATCLIKGIPPLDAVCLAVTAAAMHAIGCGPPGDRLTIEWAKTP